MPDKLTKTIERACTKCGGRVLSDEGFAFCKRCNRWVCVSRRALRRIKNREKLQ